MATVLFPDELIDSRTLLHQAHCSRQSTFLLDSFLDKAFAAVRDEIRGLPRAARAQIPTFHSLFDLSERTHGSENISLEISCALSCACQLGHLIG